MTRNASGKEYGWLRWGYKVFWFIVLAGIGSCSVLTPPKQLVVDRNGVPKDWWSHTELRVQGAAFYEAQIKVVGYAIQIQERDIQRRKDQYIRQEEMRAHFEAVIPKQQNRNPYFAQADRLEEQADRLAEQAEQLREQGIRNMMDDGDQKRLEELRQTEQALLRLQWRHDKGPSSQ